MWFQSTSRRNTLPVAPFDRELEEKEEESEECKKAEAEAEEEKEENSEKGASVDQQRSKKNNIKWA